MINVFNYLLIFNVFAGGFVLLTSPFEFYLGYLFIIAFLTAYIIRFKSVRINSNFLVLLMILTATSLINVYLGNDTFFFMTKQIFGIFLTGCAYYFLIKVNNFDTKKLFKIYLRIALVVAIIGILQELSFSVGFKSGYDYSWFIQKWKFIPATGGMLRVNSIFAEPSHLATTMAPALFVSMMAVLKNRCCYIDRISAGLIIVCYLFTFSAIAYIAIIASLFIIYFNKKDNRFLLIILIMSIFVGLAYFYIPEIHMRIYDVFGLVSGSRKLTESHLSIYALISNAFVAFKSFMDSFLFGLGLGSHPLSYDRLIRPEAPNIFWAPTYSGVNKNDAGSLFLRLLSETGIFGLSVVFYFIFKFRFRDRIKGEQWIMSSAIFLIFFLQVLRQGHYFYNGLFFFVWIYYFSYKIHKNGYLIAKA